MVNKAEMAQMEDPNPPIMGGATGSRLKALSIIAEASPDDSQAKVEMQAIKRLL